jgi:hypothetical protein
MERDLDIEHPTHGLVHVNAVMAVLALLTGSCTQGFVRSDKLFVADASPERVARLEAATAIQTEVSLSIDASDPLIDDASNRLGTFLAANPTFESRERMVVATDELLHEWVSLLDGRGNEINEVAALIALRGEVSLEEIAERMKISVAADCA